MDLVLVVQHLTLCASSSGVLSKYFESKMKTRWEVPMQPASARDMQPAISLLEKTPRLLETMLCDLPGELLHWKPAPERWAISEVLAHLAALEQVYA